MLNRVVLIGRLTKDLELRKTESGKSVLSFTIAVNRKFDKDKADFINCVAWNQTAEFMSSYLGKGSLISVEGRMETRTYEDKDGKTVYVTEIVCDSVNALESRKDREQEHQTGTQDEPSLDITSDDLPF